MDFIICSVQDESGGRGSLSTYEMRAGEFASVLRMALEEIGAAEVPRFSKCDERPACVISRFDWEWWRWCWYRGVVIGN